MSFSVGAHADKDNVVTELHDKFAGTVSDPTEGATALFEKAAKFVADFFEGVHPDDNGHYSVSVSGHANETGGDNPARDYVSVSINPALAPEPAPENDAPVATEADEQPASE